MLLIGFGGLGQFAIQYLRRLPDLTIAVRELDPDKLALAAELGADLGLLAGDESLVTLGLGGHADVVFDFVGTDETLDYAARNVEPGGLISLVGEAGGHLAFGFDRPPVESSPPLPPGARSPTCARWCGWLRAAGCAGRWSACRCARRAPPTIGCWPARSRAGSSSRP